MDGVKEVTVYCLLLGCLLSFSRVEESGETELKVKYLVEKVPAST